MNDHAKIDIARGPRPADVLAKALGLEGAWRFREYGETARSGDWCDFEALRLAPPNPEDGAEVKTIRVGAWSGGGNTWTKVQTWSEMDGYQLLPDEEWDVITSDRWPDTP